MTKRQYSWETILATGFRIDSRDRFQPGVMIGVYEVVGPAFHCGKYWKFVVKCTTCGNVSAHTTEFPRVPRDKCTCRVGLVKHWAYRVWDAMKERCYNPKNEDYKNYGGRGISVCQEWLDSSSSFIRWADSVLSAMPKNSDGRNLLEIDRIDNNGNYEPGNCRWVGRDVNGSNKRVCIRFDFGGDSKTIAEWSRDRRCLVSYATLHHRLKLLKWDVGIAITAPSSYGRRHGRL